MKWSYIRELVIIEDIQFLCIRESKKEEATKEMCLAIWGNQEMQWSFVPSGGMICIWDPLCFSMSSCFHEEGFLGLEGIWRKKSERLS